MKLDTSSIIKEYDSRQEAYKKLGEQAKYLLHGQIEKHKIKIHDINYRIKKINSLLDKIRNKNIVDPFKNIHDLVGIRVVCLLLSDLNDIRKIVKDEFDVIKEDDKIDDAEPNIFGYMSIHVEAKLKHSSENNADNSTEDMIFEIQIRTIAQDAWASICHYLDYKKENVIPKELKRDFYALSGLFYVADTHISFIKKEQVNQIIEKIKK